MHKIGLFSLLLITLYNGFAQVEPFVGDERKKILRSLTFNCESHNTYEKSFGTISNKIDTIIYKGYTVQIDFQIIYSFNADECIKLDYQISDFYCGANNIHRIYFKNSWRINAFGQMINKRKSIIAEMKEIEEAPFFYQVSFSKMDSKISRKEFRQLEKVDKKLIDTGKYLIPKTK